MINLRNSQGKVIPSSRKIRQNEYYKLLLYSEINTRLQNTQNLIDDGNDISIIQSNILFSKNKATCFD